NTTKSQKFFYIGLIVIAYMLGGILSLVNYIQYIPIKGINELWSSYRSTIGGDINIYNGVTLLRVLLCLFLLISSERIYVRNNLVFLLTKIYSIAIAAFVLFANLPVVAWRVSELFMIIEIILLPFLIYAFKKENLIARFAIVFVGGIFLFVNISYSQFLK
ncbi:MAG: EpsG family protein, partial [Bacteroidaceae bacterium]